MICRVINDWKIRNIADNFVLFLAFIFGFHGHLAEKKTAYFLPSIPPPPGHLPENKHSIFSKGNFCLWNINIIISYHTYFYQFLFLFSPITYTIFISIYLFLFFYVFLILFWHVLLLCPFGGTSCSIQTLALENGPTRTRIIVISLEKTVLGGSGKTTLIHCLLFALVQTLSTVCHTK
jgi:hypothetical protein